MKHILITGGAGFIGSHTTDYFLDRDWCVTVLDNFSTGKKHYLQTTHPHLQIIDQDVLNYSVLAALIAKFDAVLHLAALPSVPKSMESPIESLKINTLGFLNVLQAIRDSGKNIRLVYASSAAIYGAIAQLPCDDNIPSHFDVLSPYALEKANNERYATLFANAFGIKSLGMRYFNVYGTRQDPNSPYSGVISKFLDHYKKNIPIQIFGNGEQSRDFIHVSDVARANFLAIQNDYCGALNIATGQSENLNNLLKYIETAGKMKANVKYSAARVGDIPHSYANILKAQKYLQFSASCTLEQGIHSLVKDSVEACHVEENQGPL